MALTIKEKELVCIGVSVAAGCKPCTNYHFKKVKEAGASKEEIQQAISDAMCVRNSAKEIMEAHGLKLLRITQDADGCACTDQTTRIKELVSIAAAYAVNCTSNLEKHISTARTLSIANDEIKSVLDTALFIKAQAASHVDKIAGEFGVEASNENAEGCGCGDDDSTETVAENDCGCGGDC